MANGPSSDVLAEPCCPTRQSRVEGQRVPGRVGRIQPVLATLASCCPTRSRQRTYAGNLLILAGADQHSSQIAFHVCYWKLGRRERLN